jgi:site-specific recombinase XerD
MDLYEDRHFQDWVRSRNIRESTIKEYEKSLRPYCVFIGKTPTELIEEAEDEEDQRIRMKNRKIKKYFLDFHEHMKKRKLKYNSIRRSMTVLKNFYGE